MRDITRVFFFASSKRALLRSISSGACDLRSDPPCKILTLTMDFCDSIQYRMHPEISVFPSKQFYESRLKDGPEMDVKTRQPWHANPLFPPYAFFNVRNSREDKGRVGHSFLNRPEAEIAVAIYGKLVEEYPDVDLDYRVGVVTPYKGQVGELRRQFRSRFGDSILSRVDFNTVDGFQGQEKSVIILSCVRGGDAAREIGFLKDIRRMNVALTRAVSSLFILGNSTVLQTNSNWKPLIEDARERGVHREVRGHVTWELHFATRSGDDLLNSVLCLYRLDLRRSGLLHERLRYRKWCPRRRSSAGQRRLHRLRNPLCLRDRS
jgi:hypothetical protein